MTATALNSLLAYLLGSVSGSLLLGRLRQVDIRRLGSGNAGGTNALRTQGLTFALGVVIIDIGKGVLAAFLPAWLIWGSAPQATAPLFCAMAAVIGHCFPIWHGFRGGKGAATAVGAVLVIQPFALIPMLSVWLICLVVTGWVGLSTMLAGVSLVPALMWLEAPRAQWVFGLAVALFLIFTHRNNIRAMINGSEHKFERVRVHNWFRHG
ncbi:MAG TPA: glycerol-3-phosphate 1-O-acyltransferase PlsY [Xanthomonadales bacterium]|nr:glycerol-3-phosphate 1-O-acyltransferase PlsY [Xanthomonadales bacterium]